MIKKYRCPYCGSHNITVIYSEPMENYSLLMQRYFREGRYYWTDDPKKKGFGWNCFDCDRAWNSSDLQKEPEKYLRKARYRIIEEENNYTLGSRIFEIYPDGKVRYTDHVGESRKARHTLTGYIPQAKAMALIERLRFIYPGDKEPFYSSEYTGTMCSLTITWADDIKDEFRGDSEEFVVLNTIKHAVKEIPMMESIMNLEFPQPEPPEYHEETPEERAERMLLREKLLTEKFTPDTLAELEDNEINSKIIDCIHALNDEEFNGAHLFDEIQNELPRDFFFVNSLDDLNRDYGKNEIVVTELARRYCAYQLEYEYRWAEIEELLGADYGEPEETEGWHEEFHAD